MKNSEAKTKICPFVGTFNLTSENTKQSRWETTRFICCAEKCMAWEDTSNQYSEDKQGYCKRLGK